MWAIREPAAHLAGALSSRVARPHLALTVRSMLQFDEAGAGGASFTGAFGAARVPTFGGDAEAAGADTLADADAEADALAAGLASPFFDHTTRPKRDALWKLPWAEDGATRRPRRCFSWRRS